MKTLSISKQTTNTKLTVPSIKFAAKHAPMIAAYKKLEKNMALNLVNNVSCTMVREEFPHSEETTKSQQNELLNRSQTWPINNGNRSSSKR